MTSGRATLIAPPIRLLPATEGNVVALEESIHSMAGVEKCYNLRAKQSLDAYVKSRVLKWLVRRLYDLCGISGDFRLHDMGTVLYEDVARAIVSQKNLEARSLKPGDKGYGFVWEFKESPVSRILGFESVRYGAVEYSGTDIDSRFLARHPTRLVDERISQKAVEGLRRVNAQLDETLASVRAATTSL
jgi:hypothetical protein